MICAYLYAVIMESFNIIKPTAILAPFVNHYWSLKVGGSMPAGERVIPTGSVSLVFHRADPMISQAEGRVQPRAFVSGVSMGYEDLTATGALDMLVVVFKPLGSGAFLNVPLDEFRNSNVAVAQTGDIQLRDLSERVLDARSDREAAALIEQFLISRLHRHEGYTFRRIESALQQINNNPFADVASSADIACLSARQFNRIFSAQVGVRPKEFMRIVRFQRALYTLQLSPATNLAQLAAGCGYYDQAHMTREFREFSGYTPLEYISVCAPYSDYFSV